MITRVLSAGLLAGLVAGLAIAVLQNFTTTPLILAAEVFEKAGEQAGSRATPDRGEARVVLVHSAHEEGAAPAGEEEWGPEDGLERFLYTSTATIGAAVGFAFLLLGGMLAAGGTITERRAIGWAAAAFVAAGLAPAAGLSPELPGMPAADLLARQSWWLLTAALTAFGIWLFNFGERAVWRALAVVLIAVPHIVGAPHLDVAETSKVPAELAARFAGVSLAVQAALWIATGVAVAFFWQRLGRLAVQPGVAA